MYLSKILVKKSDKKSVCVSYAFCYTIGLALLVSMTALIRAGALPRGDKAGGKTNATPMTGKQVFGQQCAVCHGAAGQGAKAYPKPLTGTRSAQELARYIAQTMPPGPRKCTASDAQRVAAYIYDAFYSPIAQARSGAVRVALSRLTVRQFRNAVSDLVGSFRAPGKTDAQHGLRGEYYKARRFDDGERLLQRVDPEVHFDFGQSGPIADKFDPHQFSIRWNGAVMAPDTGEYDFVVRTEHSMRLWVNNQQQPLIDAWVKSGKETEFRGSLFLIGGHTYPVRLEFSKSTQGVDDTDKQKNRPIPSASIALAWKRPKQADEVIPQRCLLPLTFPETFVPTTPFPADDRSTGYERGNSVNKAWDEATTAAALETSAYVTAHLRELADAREDAPDREKRLRDFCRQFVERAFRRPLPDDIAKFYIDRQFKVASDLTMAVKRVVILALKSPRFLYREIGSDKPDAYDIASRLSFALWDSVPDPELLKAAASGELATHEQVTHQAERLAADPRATFKLREFLLQWLKVDQSPDLVKDAKRYPGFDAAAASDLRTSLELSLQNVLGSEQADYRELMLTDKVFLNGRLAKIYGVNLPPDAPFQPVALDPTERAGVLAHPYLLSSFAYLDTSSPIHRGVLIARNLLGRTLAPPPIAFAPLAADLHPNMTTRQRVAMQTKPAACNGCHGMINPLGFTLERFDAIGRLQARENSQPIDATGSYRDRSGKAIQFNGERDLARYIAGSDEAHAAFVEKLFQNLTKQPVRAYGAQLLPGLEHSFAAHEFNIRRLTVEMATESAIMRYNHEATIPEKKPHSSSNQAAVLQSNLKQTIASIPRRRNL